jgi:hypothetical protein
MIIAECSSLSQQPDLFRLPLALRAAGTRVSAVGFQSSNADRSTHQSVVKHAVKTVATAEPDSTSIIEVVIYSDI